MNCIVSTFAIVAYSIVHSVAGVEVSSATFHATFIALCVCLLHCVYLLLQGLPFSNFFPYKSSYHFLYLNCCQILYLNATDLRIGSSTYFFLLFSFLVFTKCQVLNLRVGTRVGHVTRSCKGPIAHVDTPTIYTCLYSLALTHSLFLSLRS